jgi:acetyl-CoA carboxylase biotin carboxyl carrier protein
MKESVLVVRCRAGAGDRLEVLSPDVGWWSDHPRDGSLVGPSGAAGRLTSLHHRFTLVLPESASGQAAVSSSRRAIAVGSGQVLFEVAPLQGVTGVAGRSRAAGADPVGPGVAAHAVVAPTDGFFYRGPSPGAPPFVGIGTRVRAGEPVGLVEVMKTFNHILYGGPGLPEHAEVAEIRVGDAEEVHAGQILVVVRPLP